MADEPSKIWWTWVPERSGRVVWTHEFRNPERERLARRALAEMILRSRAERDR
jgi:hypothetical protein